jgi:hypothetical protein
MPNWCFIEARVWDRDERTIDLPNLPTPEDAILNHIRPDEINGGERFDFDTLIPMPPDLDNGAYCDWAREHWGTKWNSCDTQKHWVASGARTSMQRVICFNTPWTSPHPIFLAWSKAYPHLEFDFDCEYEGEDESEVFYYAQGELKDSYLYVNECSECGEPVTDHAPDCEMHPDFESPDRNEEEEEEEEGTLCPFGYRVNNDCNDCLFGDKSHLVEGQCVPRQCARVN